MKFINKSASFKYTLLFCLIVVLSFTSAYCLTLLIQEKFTAVKDPSLNRQQLLQNYRFLIYFLNTTPVRSLNEVERVDLENPLLAACEQLNQAQKFFLDKKFDLSSSLLISIPGKYPHIAEKRDALQLRNLYATQKHQSFIAYYDAHPLANLEIKILLLNCLLKSKLNERAQSEFSLLFATSSLPPFLSMMPRPAVLGMLQRLDEDIWFNKFSFLLKNADNGEFRRELPYCRHRPLIRLFRAEFAYLSRNYAQAQGLLREDLAEKYQLFAEKILVKIAVRQDAQTDVLDRLRMIKKNSRLYTELLFDTAQILVGKGEFSKALPLYALYLQQTRERGEDYWKTIWLMAWIFYRQDRKNLALNYFQKGSQSPFLNYRIASRYWQNKMQNKKQDELQHYPFSYYAVKVLPDKAQFKNAHQKFVSEIAAPPSARFLEISTDLKILAKYGLWDDCLETIHWAKNDQRLSASDLNLLKIIESLIYYQQNRFFMAFNKFRGNFQYYQSVRLPKFLSGIFFPRQYVNLIETYCKENSLDPSLALALIREESFFRPDSLSSANAYGLMQLLHVTAREIASGSDLKVKAKDLYDPEINIRLGLNYLKTLLEKYDGRLYLALAAYNAGPNRVDQWLLDFSEADEDEFIEMIPFSETRNYVKNILRNYFFYRYYYDTGKP